jgi:hypothetical protein
MDIRRVRGRRTGSADKKRRILSFLGGAGVAASGAASLQRVLGILLAVCLWVRYVIHRRHRGHCVVAPHQSIEKES